MKGASKTKSFILALIIILGLIFFNYPSIASQIKNFCYSISSPIQNYFDHLLKQASSSWEFLKSLKEISKKNTYLEEQIKELSAQNIELKELEKENKFLRSYLNLSARQRYQVNLANIIGRDFQGLEKYILIDKGLSDGIKETMPVIVFENILIGNVVEVFDNFSKVLLISSSNSKVPALIQETRTEGLIEGLEENLLFLDLIPKNIDVKEGQTVIASGTGGNFPGGLLIGKITKIELLENKMFQTIEVSPSINTKELEQVFVIKNK